MKLTLDESQRLNLHTILGGQRGTVDDIRLCWRIQDRIALSEEDKQRIAFTVTQSNGNQMASWDVRMMHANEYDFPPEESARIARAMKEWQPGFGAYDRTWLEPLLAQLDTTEVK